MLLPRLGHGCSCGPRILVVTHIHINSYCLFINTLSSKSVKKFYLQRREVVLMKEVFFEGENFISLHLIEISLSDSYFCLFRIYRQNGLDTKVEKSRKQLKERKNRAKKIRGVKKVENNREPFFSPLFFKDKKCIADILIFLIIEYPDKGQWCCKEEVKPFGIFWLCNSTCKEFSLGAAFCP